MGYTFVWNSRSARAAKTILFSAQTRAIAAIGVREWWFGSNRVNAPKCIWSVAVFLRSWKFSFSCAKRMQEPLFNKRRNGWPREGEISPCTRSVLGTGRFFVRLSNEPIGSLERRDDVFVLRHSLEKGNPIIAWSDVRPIRIGSPASLRLRGAGSMSLGDDARGHLSFGGGEGKMTQNKIQQKFKQKRNRKWKNGTWS